MLKVIRKRHVIPLSTSPVRFEPAYYRPLLDAKYRPGIADPMSKVVCDDIPVEARSPSMLWRIFADVNDEVERVRQEFGSIKDRDGRLIFDTIYPGDALPRAILAEIEATEAAEENIVHEAEISSDLKALAGRVKGLTEARMKTLTAAGCGNLPSIAGQAPETLAALEDINLTLAKRLVSAAQAAVPAALAGSGDRLGTPEPYKPGKFNAEVVPLGAGIMG